MRILVAEDDFILSDVITKTLRQSGYAVDCLNSGNDVEFATLKEPYDLMILDLGLPQKDGLDVLKSIRNKGNQLPILILTARNTLDDRITGLDLGADDYMTKPFELRELEARIRALLRRKHFDSLTILSYGPFRFDTAKHQLYYQEELIELSMKEVGILELLLSNMGKVMNKSVLLEHLYGWDNEISKNAIEVYIHRLRKKLEPYGFQLKTIKGLGYIIEEMP